MTFLDRPKSKFYAAISKNDVNIFGKKLPRKTESKALKLAQVKTDVNLFARMYISCQSREVDMEVFFQHENHPWPPSLAENGRMRTADNKSDILLELEPMQLSQTTIPYADVKIVDGSALVQSLDPAKNGKLKDFLDYTEKVFLPNIERKLEMCSRCDIIFDVYVENSLKRHTREARGIGESLKIEESTRLPKDWHSFLRVDDNKTALFVFLAEIIRCLRIPYSKTLVVTKQGSVIDPSELAPCNHEESDTRVFLHCKHAYNQGLS